MANFKEYGGHFPRSGMTRSKIVILKVGDALRNLGCGVYVLSVSTALGSKVITIKVPRYQLADISGHKLHLPDPPAKPAFGSNNAHEAMARPLDVRPRRSAISVSGTGSPRRREDAQAILKSDQEHLTDSSNEKAEPSSYAQVTPEGMYGNPLKPLSLNQEDSPPFHQHMSLSLFKQKMQSPSLNLQIGLSPPDWRLRQAPFQRQLDLSTYNQQGSSTWLSRQTWDTKISLPTSSTPGENLNHPLGSRYAPLPYILPTEYASSSGPTLMNNQPFLPSSMSAAFAMKGRSHKPHSGAHDLPVSGSTATDPDELETPEEFKERLTYSIEQMMFVSGETAEASPETTGMIEEIVRAQVIEMVSLFHSVSVAALPLMKTPSESTPSASALATSKFSHGPSQAYLAAAQTSNRACQS
jgi:Transcription initiation factor IID, 18kD subunit